MVTEVQTHLSKIDISGHEQAWEMVTSQLRLEMSKAVFESWVQPLTPLGLLNGTFRLGTTNPYVRDWVENRLKNQITRLLEGLYNQEIQLRIEVKNEFYRTAEELVEEEEETEPQTEKPPAAKPAKKEKTSQTKNESNSKRKIALQRAYGSQRAAVIQPERTMLVTQYFFNNWLPLLGHSAFAIIMAARSMCYWNPLTGELRNEIETEISELAERAAVSVRTAKTVLKTDLVEKYFLRYKTRRIFTPNGVRTAGIILQVRMDDPLIPEDQETYDLEESDYWFTAAE